MSKKGFVPERLRVWIEARDRLHLSHAHVQMARELGFNPKSLRHLAATDAEPWKAPLPEYLEHLYRKRFSRERPEVVRPLEELAQREAERKAVRRALRAERTAPAPAPATGMVIAVADYAPEQWPRFRELCVDREEMALTHAEWLATGERALADLRARGAKVQVVKVDVEELARWCREQGRPLDGPARAQYLTEMARRAAGGTVAPPP
ncbi:MAG: hypothetical protein HZA54_13535 [Planctomycetes bacterium]|nr:hypothetical protein [Planctomycetota bacterium]